MKYNLNTMSLMEKYIQLEEELIDLYEEYKENIITKKQYKEYSNIIFKQLELLGYYE